MSTDKARDVARACKALANHLAEFDLPREAAIAMRASQWRLTYSIAVAQTGKGDGGAESGVGPPPPVLDATGLPA